MRSQSTARDECQRSGELLGADAGGKLLPRGHLRAEDKDPRGEPLPGAQRALHSELFPTGPGAPSGRGSSSGRNPGHGPSDSDVGRG